MLVHRSIWRAKRGSVRKLREVAAAEVKEMHAPHATRTLVPAYGGSYEVTIYEFGFADIAEYDALWAEWSKTRENAFFAKMDPLAESISEELFRLAD